jgi:hypothetical protein
MRYLAILAAGVALAGCEGGPGMPTIFTGGGGGGGAPVDPARQAQFVALVEQQGCRVDPADHQYIHDAGFTDLELGDFGQTLAAEGRAEITADGGLLLLTERCI